MYVACPSCKTLYQIQAEHLHAAGGRVRCAACRSTFSATNAVYDDPAQALAFAERQYVERDIEELVSRALDQVPGGDEQAEHQRSEAAAAGEDSAAVAGGEDQTPDAAYVPDDTQDGGARPPESQQAEASDEPPAGAGSQASAAPQGTDEAPDQPPSIPVPCDEAEGAEGGGPATPPGEAAPAAEPAARQDTSATGSRTTRDALAAVSSPPPGLRADMDFQAQPLAGEFVSRRDEAGEADEFESRVSDVLLLEHEYHEGVSHAAWGAIAASLLLIAVLVAQYGYVERYRLAAVPELRPLLEFGCRHLGCDLPLRRDIAQVEILEREVRDHPNVDDALLINVSFVNQAGFVQPYPVFAVSFSDVSGAPVAARRFRADEYLPHSRDLTQGMQAGERAQLMLEVVDPGDRAVSFQFDFL